jgi:peptide-methionine (R)-S-oxide reductase
LRVILARKPTTYIVGNRRAAHFCNGTNIPQAERIEFHEIAAGISQHSDRRPPAVALIPYSLTGWYLAMRYTFVLSLVLAGLVGCDSSTCPVTPTSPTGSGSSVATPTEAPDTPDTPNTLETPNSPNTPNTPDTPGAPDTPPMPAESAETARSEEDPSDETSSKEPEMPEKIVRTEEEWKRLLTPAQYYVLREKGTERPFVNEFDHHFEPGVYACAACGQELFSSTTKFNSGCGWPAFYAAQAGDLVKLTTDSSLGLVRTEVTCAACDSHLGHIFDDAPQTPTGQRYCINSVSLKFIPNRSQETPQTEPESATPPNASVESPSP